MKKLILISLFIIFILYLFLILKNVDNEKLDNNIYIDKSSIKIEDTNTISAWFKVYPEDNKNINYEKLLFVAYCSDKVLYLKENEIYDFDNKLTEKSINKSLVSANYLSYANGEIYYNALCKNF